MIWATHVDWQEIHGEPDHAADLCENTRHCLERLLFLMRRANRIFKSCRTIRTRTSIRSNIMFTDKSLKELHGKLKKIGRNSSPLDVPIKETSDMTWVEPELVCNIKFTEITDDGSVRHPVFQGLRVDKSAREVKLEKPVPKSKIK